MKLNNIIKSHKDNTIKYIFETDDNLIVEFSYINKNDGKDIICVPSQTMCNLACKFCHTTDFIGKIRNRNLTSEEITEPIDYIIDDLNLSTHKRTLLISYMGCGEPILNYQNILDSMIYLKSLEEYISYVRFAVATSIPHNSISNFYKLTNGISENKLPVKLHLSLHYTTNDVRKKWMPASSDIDTCLSLSFMYKNITKNSVEIHYALIEDLNDTEDDAIRLSELIRNKEFNVKFLFYNEKESLDYHTSNTDKIKTFEKYLDKYSIEHEYYIPPGLDIGASCGQFLMEHYNKI